MHHPYVNVRGICAFKWTHVYADFALRDEGACVVGTQVPQLYIYKNDALSSRRYDVHC